jgi:hypothetical protein
VPRAFWACLGITIPVTYGFLAVHPGSLSMGLFLPVRLAPVHPEDWEPGRLTRQAGLVTLPTHLRRISRLSRSSRLAPFPPRPQRRKLHPTHRQHLATTTRDSIQLTSCSSPELGIFGISGGHQGAFNLAVDCPRCYRFSSALLGLAISTISAAISRAGRRRRSRTTTERTSRVFVSLCASQL